MSDDLINRLRTLMAEIEARLGAEQQLTTGGYRPDPPRALSTPAVGADVGAEPIDQTKLPDQSRGYDLSMADIRSATPAKQRRPTDYVPTHHDILHDDDTYNPEDFIGTGDNDPLGHEAMSRGR